MIATIKSITGANAVLDAAVLEHDAGAGDRALRAVYAFLGRFIAYPSEHARVAHTLWIAHTHCMDAWHTTPRLAFMSAEKESGKTRALEVTELLTPGALLSFNLSPAALVRKIAAGGATVLFDEIDALFGSAKREEANVDVRSILNSGYRRGAKAYRCVMAGGRRIEVEELDSFAPVALAGLRDLPDTLGSRAIIIRMRRRAPDEGVEPFRLRHVAAPAAVLYEQLAVWCANLGPTEPEMPDGVTDRAAECWEPLLAVADAAGGAWPQRARAAAVHFVQGGRDEGMSPGVELLEHIREALAGEDAVWTETLLARLHGRPESPWRDVKGKPLDDRGLARRLRGFNIKSRDVRLPEHATAKKGYRAEDFHDAWKRYLGPASATATSATSATKLINQNNYVADVAEVALSPPTSATATSAKGNGRSGGADGGLAGSEILDGVCVHCGRLGGRLVRVAVPDGPPEGVPLHRGCVDAWYALDVPEALRR
jgi:Protein of unknown function (DUF3631)